MRFLNLLKLTGYSVVYYFAAVGVRVPTSGGNEIGYWAGGLFYGMAAGCLLLGVLSTVFASDELIEEVMKKD